MKIGHNHDKSQLNGVDSINGVNNGSATTGPASTASTAADAAAGVNAIPREADASAKIELSSTASTLLSKGVTAEFDAEKVERIRTAIENGTFTINADAIAGKLLSNAQELLTKVQS